MNKYLKKCLVTYIALTVILCSMAGIAYAVTATDADSYVTRSQFSTDMTYLQTIIGEQEAALIGSINKYRSTDVKFVTFDTPTTQVTGTNFESGKFTGGNYYPRTKFSSSSGNMYPFGTSAISARTDGMYQMSGNQISVKTLDLNCSFAQIAVQLDRIAVDQFLVESPNHVQFIF